MSKGSVRWSIEQLTAHVRKFPESRVTQDIRSENTRKTTSVECNLGNAPLEKVQVQTGSSGRVLIRVTSVRKRLADEDGLCEKYHVDCLRYAGVIQNDDPGKAKIETSQRKAEKGEEEFTRIEVFQLP